MKESEFIKQNKEKWQEFENNLLKGDGDPSKTSKLFVQITDDLSYARTFYQNRSVRLYLNGSAKILFNDLNKSKKKGLQLFVKFWKQDLPLALFEARRPMLISLCVFAACFILGIITSLQDKDFANQILSVDYVNMTEANIKKGDAMAVYKSKDELRTFLPILYNNLKVDFLTFFSGIFMAIGTLVVMVTNGVMVGVFQYFFIERGLFWESFLGIWTHGALEIPAIILSGGAGLMLGKGLLFPGTYSRFQAFKLSGMMGLKIIMGVIPVTIIAAFIEGFLTRHTDIPNVLRFSFILLSFGSVLAYFVIYPRRVARIFAGQTDGDKQLLIYKAESEFDPSEIYSSGKILTETFRYLFGNFSFFGKWLILIPLAASVLVTYNPIGLFFASENTTFGANHFYDYENYPLLGVLAVCLTALLTTFFTGYTRRVLLSANAETKDQPLLPGRAILTAFFSMLLYGFIIYSGVDFSNAIAQFLFPLLVFLVVVSVYEDLHFFDVIGRAFNLLNQSWPRFIAAAVLFAGISLTLFTTIMYGLRLLLLQDALTWMFTDDEMYANKIVMGMSIFDSFFSLLLYVALLTISSSLLYFTLKEIGTAEQLLSKIKKLKFGK